MFGNVFPYPVPRDSISKYMASITALFSSAELTRI